MNIVGPAGEFEKMQAAIKAGADEVYFGIKGFGARRNNQNFGIEETLKAIDYAHSKGVKTLLTLNTLMKNQEIDALYSNLSKIYEHGIDAVIIQDLGLFNFIKMNFPDFAIHGSTQMTVANHIEANELKRLGFSRVVLARELSFEEIKDIRKKTDIELEIFVSGSLCIAYSGNCYISSFIGGRSGNRGLCAYTCRKKFKDTEGNEAYYLSPNDQFFEKEEIEKLRSIGIDAIKIEGRKKSVNYVYETVDFYKSILDSKERKSESYKLFNRGYSKGYFNNDNELMNQKYSSNFGYKIAEKEIGTSEIKLLDDIVLGDGIQYVDENYNKVDGNFINKIKIRDNKVSKAYKDDRVILDKLSESVKYVYKSFSKETQDKIDHEIKIRKKTIPIAMKLEALINRELSLICYGKNLYDKSIEIELSGIVLDQIAKNEISKKMIIEKLSELGDTSFHLADCEINYDEKAFVPFSELKKMKREIIEKYNDELLRSYRRKNVEERKILFSNKEKREPVIISALVQNKQQENICKEYGIDKIYYSQVDVAKEKNLERINRASQLISNLYQLVEGQKNKINNQTLNWNLNVFNNYTLNLLSQYENIETVFLSPELSIENLRNIKTNKLKTGLVIYGFLKSMYIEYPIIEAKKKILKEEHGDVYTLVKNEFNNVEIYLDKPLNLIPRMDEIKEFPIDELRLDFTFESEEEMRNILGSLNDKKSKYNPYSFGTGVF